MKYPTMSPPVRRGWGPRASCDKAVCPHSSQLQGEKRNPHIASVGRGRVGRRVHNFSVPTHLCPHPALQSQNSRLWGGGGGVGVAVSPTLNPFSFTQNKYLTCTPRHQRCLRLSRRDKGGTAESRIHIFRCHLAVFCSLHLGIISPFPVPPQLGCQTSLTRLQEAPAYKALLWTPT